MGRLDGPDFSRPALRVSLVSNRCSGFVMVPALGIGRRVVSGDGRANARSTPALGAVPQCGHDVGREALQRLHRFGWFEPG